MVEVVVVLWSLIACILHHSRFLLEDKASTSFYRHLLCHSHHLQSCALICCAGVSPVLYNLTFGVWMTKRGAKEVMVIGSLFATFGLTCMFVFRSQASFLIGYVCDKHSFNYHALEYVALAGLLVSSNDSLYSLLAYGISYLIYSLKPHNLNYQ